MQQVLLTQSRPVLQQMPPQATSPLGQAQLPLWHVSPPVHMLPHVPQLLLSPRVPLAQAQLPLWQVVPFMHTVLQLPQWLLSAWVLTQAPLQQVPPEQHCELPEQPLSPRAMQDTHVLVEVSQFPEQHWELPVQCFPFAAQQAPLLQVWPELQQAARLVSLQQLCPLVQQATAPPGAMQAAPPELPHLPQVVTQAL
jgi:hypothetical protein